MSKFSLTRTLVGVALGAGAVALTLGTGGLGALALGGLAGAALTNLGALIPLPKIPEGLKQSGQYGDATLRVNRNRLGSAKPLVLGRVKMWFALCAEPYVGYYDHDQRYYAWLHASVGEVDVTDLKIGDRLVNALPGSTAEVLAINQPVTLAHPNVWTNPDADGIELRGGALSLVEEFTVTVQVRRNGSLISPDPDFFDDARVGSTLVISGNPTYNGSYRIVAAGRTNFGDAPSFVRLDTTFPADTSATLTLSFAQFAGDGTALLVEDVTLTLAASPPRLTAPAGSLGPLLEGDQIAFPDSDANRGTVFTVVASDFDSSVTLDPAPVDEVLEDSAVQLISRSPGSFYSCPRGETSTRTQVFVFFDTGLGNQNKDGKVVDYTVGVLFDWRPVDDAGNPLGGWTTQLETFTDNVIGKARRYQREIVYPTAMRVEIKPRRATSDYTGKKSDIFSACKLAGLQSFLEPRAGETFGYSDDSTTVAVALRASGLLSAQQQRTLNGVVQSRVQTWSMGGGWGAAVASSNPYWLCLHLLRNYSGGTYTDADLDLPTFATRAAAADVAGVEFNGLFDGDEAPLLWDAAIAILRVDRAYPYRDPITGKVTVGRDEQGAPSLLFVDGINCDLGQPEIALGNTDDPTGVQVQFTDFDTWTTRDDGPIQGGDARLQRVEFFGCTSWALAYGEAVRLRREQLYRTLRATARTEMDGQLARLRRPVLVASRRYGFGSGGEVTAASGNTLQLSQAPEWVAGASHYLVLQGPDGLPGAAIDCTRGASDTEAVLATAPDVVLRDGPGSKGRTVYAFGQRAFGSVPASEPMAMLVESAAADGFTEVSLQLVNDDPRVYAPIGPIPPDPRAPVGVATDLVIDGLTVTLGP